MRVWITKYALSAGIYDVAAEECGDGMVKEIGARFSTYYHGEGREWHRTKESAAARAEELRKAKIKSLKRQLAKLESLTFAALEKINADT